MKSPSSLAPDNWSAGCFQKLKNNDVNNNIGSQKLECMTFKKPTASQMANLKEQQQHPELSFEQYQEQVNSQARFIVPELAQLKSQLNRVKAQFSQMNRKYRSAMLNIQFYNFKEQSSLRIAKKDFKTGKLGKNIFSEQDQLNQSMVSLSDGLSLEEKNRQYLLKLLVQKLGGKMLISSLKTNMLKKRIHILSQCLLQKHQLEASIKQSPYKQQQVSFESITSQAQNVDLQNQLKSRNDRDGEDDNEDDENQKLMDLWNNKLIIFVQITYGMIKKKRIYEAFMRINSMENANDMYEIQPAQEIRNSQILNGNQKSGQEENQKQQDRKYQRDFGYDDNDNDNNGNYFSKSGVMQTQQHEAQPHPRRLLETQYVNLTTGPQNEEVDEIIKQGIGNFQDSASNDDQMDSQSSGNQREEDDRQLQKMKELIYYISDVKKQARETESLLKRSFLRWKAYLLERILQEYDQQQDIKQSGGDVIKRQSQQKYQNQHKSPSGQRSYQQNEDQVIVNVYHRQDRKIQNYPQNLQQKQNYRQINSSKKAKQKKQKVRKQEHRSGKTYLQQKPQKDQYPQSNQQYSYHSDSNNSSDQHEYVTNLQQYEGIQSNVVYNNSYDYYKHQQTDSQSDFTSFLAGQYQKSSTSVKNNNSQVNLMMVNNQSQYDEYRNSINKQDLLRQKTLYLRNLLIEKQVIEFWELFEKNYTDAKLLQISDKLSQEKLLKLTMKGMKMNLEWRVTKQRMDGYYEKVATDQRLENQRLSIVTYQSNLKARAYFDFIDICKAKKLCKVLHKHSLRLGMFAVHQRSQFIRKKKINIERYLSLQQSRFLFRAFKSWKQCTIESNQHQKVKSFISFKQSQIKETAFSIIHFVYKQSLIKNKKAVNHFKNKSCLKIFEYLKFLSEQNRQMKTKKQELFQYFRFKKSIQFMQKFREFSDDQILSHRIQAKSRKLQNALNSSKIAKNLQKWRRSTIRAQSYRAIMYRLTKLKETQTKGNMLNIWRRQLYKRTGNRQGTEDDMGFNEISVGQLDQSTQHKDWLVKYYGELCSLVNH